MPLRTLDRAVAVGLAAFAVLCPERTLAQVADARNLPKQLATLLDEAVVIGAGHARLHLYPRIGNRYRSGTKAFLNPQNQDVHPNRWRRLPSTPITRP